MDFAFTAAELAFAAEARAWLGANLPPAWRRGDGLGNRAIGEPRFQLAGCLQK